MSAAQWKYFVEGVFLREAAPAKGCQAIIETADRVEGSPLRFRGVGPIAVAGEGGKCQSWFVTEGSAEPIRKPDTVTAFIRVAPGSWEPLVVPVGDGAARSESTTEMTLLLGKIVVPERYFPPSAT